MQDALRRTADDLWQSVALWAPRLRALAPDVAAARPSHGGWSPKEVVGHLVDSAANNHQRFVRAQEASVLTLPGYAQDHWVSSQDYQAEDWHALVMLWEAYNRHLAHVIARIPDAALATECRIGEGAPVTLRVIVDDYVVHLRTHLEQLGL